MLYGGIEYWKDVIHLAPCQEPFSDARVLLSYAFCKKVTDEIGSQCPVTDPATVSAQSFRSTLEDILKDQRASNPHLRLYQALPQASRVLGKAQC